MCWLLNLNFLYMLIIIICVQSISGHVINPQNRLSPNNEPRTDYEQKGDFLATRNGFENDMITKRIIYAPPLPSAEGYERDINGTPRIPFLLNRSNRKSKLQNRMKYGKRKSPKESEEFVVVEPDSESYQFLSSKYQPMKQNLVTRDKTSVYRDETNAFIIHPEGCPLGYIPDHNGICRKVFEAFYMWPKENKSLMEETFETNMVQKSEETSTINNNPENSV